MSAGAKLDEAESTIAGRSREHSEGWKLGVLEGASLMLSHLREVLEVPADKPLKGERVIVQELARRFGRELVDREWRKRGLRVAP